MSLHMLAPGLLTSVQDAGRNGSHGLGVGSSGSADAWSSRIANLLVGNGETDALLEITLTGPTLRLQRAATIALCGASIDARCDDISLPCWRPVALAAGSTLTLGACRGGARAYLAVDGGMAVPSVLASRATDLRSGFGGHEGRALRAGDVLPLGAPRSTLRATEAPWIAPWWIDAGSDLDFADCVVARVLPGSDATSSTSALFGGEFVIDPASNRQGLRLRGREPMAHGDARERISEPVVPGTVQLPPDGHPIVLLAEAQTVGGYPRIGHVIAADLPRLAQRRAGQRIAFLPVDRREAERANAGQRARLARIALAIAGRR